MKSKLMLGLAVISLLAGTQVTAGRAENNPEGPVLPLKEPEPEKIAPTAVAVTPVAPAHLFASMAGSWTGGGTIDLTNDIHERLRCRANHTYGQNNNSLALNIRCASDNYKFELTSHVVDRQGHVSGQWQEASYGVTGAISGRLAGNRVTAVATGDKFTADLSVTTNGNHQTVTITPRATYLQNVKIALSKAAPKATAAARP